MGLHQDRCAHMVTALHVILTRSCWTSRKEATSQDKRPQVIARWCGKCFCWRYSTAWCWSRCTVITHFFRHINIFGRHSPEYLLLEYYSITKLFLHWNLIFRIIRMGACTWTSISPSFAHNKYLHGISSYLCGRLSKKHLYPVTLQLIAPPLLKKAEHTQQNWACLRYFSR